MALEDQDVRAIIRGIFDLNATLADVQADVHAIRVEYLDEEDDGEEEEEDESGD